MMKQKNDETEECKTRRRKRGGGRGQQGGLGVRVETYAYVSCMWCQRLLYVRQQPHSEYNHVSIPAH
jgi:hypothetical protein